MRASSLLILFGLYEEVTNSLSIAMQRLCALLNWCKRGLGKIQSVDPSHLAMTRRVTSALPWHLLVNVLILAGWQLSLCDSAGMRTIPKLPRSTATSFDKFKRMPRDSSPVGGISSKGSSRVLLEPVKVSPLSSSKEVEVLMAFKGEITSDPLGALNNWRANNSDPCSWTGVRCSKDSNHVTTLNLTGFQLLGTVSALLGQLSFLQQLDLSDNSFSGSIPASLTNCSNLFNLNMSVNQMIGDIPTQVGQLENLQILDFSNNNLTGEIPGSLGNCSALQHLDLGTNTFHGGLPPQFGRLSNLKFLSVESTSISGSVPFNLGNCSSLTQLWLSSNTALGGELPPELGDLMRLQDFRIGDCNFQGSFPAWIFNFTAMQHLTMGFNVFFKHIPDTFGQLPQLNVLNIEENHFSGDIPSSICNTSLQELLMDSNQLTGPIPNDIGLLGRLEILKLYDNALSGLIPASLSNCSFLQLFMVGINPFDPQTLPSWIASLAHLSDIYLPEMNLQGEIPKEVGQLSQLSEMAVFLNNLTGRIPTSLGNCTALRYIDLRSNQLVGVIPSELGLLSLFELQIDFNPFSAGPFPSFIYNLSGLSLLGIGGTNLNGKLDGDFGKFQQLTDFEAFENNFEGPLPESLSNCSNLQILDIGYTNLTGEIPPGFGNLTNLVYLLLGENSLQGTIPSDLMGNFQFLELLDLSYNKLEGEIPVNIGHLSNLQTLVLSANDLTGVLPNSLANCTQLLSVDLSQNRLTGNIPGDAFARAYALASLNLSQNFLSGSWPSQFSQLANIVIINVSANNLSGSIPLGLGKCISLQTLDLSFNQLTGAIPSDLGMLKNLTSFNASYNNFDGPIPTSGAFKTNLTADSFFGNPGLCGDILGPQRQCRLGTTSHGKGSKSTRVWIPIVSTLGTIAIFIGVAMAMLIFYYRANKARKNQELVFYPVAPHEKFVESDILQTIASGEDNIIGIGAKSVVYKAILPSGEIIAIKVLKELPVAGDQDQEVKKRQEQAIESEARTLAQLRHRNVIRVFSLCSTANVKAIILEYMPEGSLHAHIDGVGPCKLSWTQRLNILLGVTHGMVYLHHEFPEPIIHRDLKPSNILLDADMEPKLCDFGISRFVTNDCGEATASTFCGTFGYIPPEYGTEARLSTKGDVYSYGVVLLELLTAKDLTPTSDITGFSQTPDLAGIVEHFLREREGSLFELFDPTLRNEAADNPTIREQMILTMRVGLFCTRALPKNRPPMKVVLEMLLQIKDAAGQGRLITPRSLDELLDDEILSTPESHDSD